MDSYIEFYKFEDVWREIIKHQPVGYLKSKKDETNVIKTKMVIITPIFFFVSSSVISTDFGLK